MNETLIVQEYVDNKKSISQIAKEYLTYPSRIQKILKNNNVKSRTKSEAQKAALESGASVHPTKDKKMSDESKSKISAKNSAKWQDKTDDELAAFKDRARENWFKKTDQDRHEMSKLAGQALFKASKNGSKAEHFVCSKLLSAGYNTQIHRKDIGGSYEVDLYLPDYAIAIEIDGPHHFIPVFGEEKLQKSIRFDGVKNGILMSKGISIIRMKYIKKHVSIFLLGKIWESIEKEIKRIVSGNLKSQLIEIEL